MLKRKEEEAIPPRAGARPCLFMPMGLLAALALAFSGAWAQGRPDLTSLQKMLASTSGQDRPAALLEVASALKKTSPQEALANALEAIPLAQTFGQTWNIIQARLIAGECYFRLKQYEKSREMLRLNHIGLKGLLLTPLAHFQGGRLREALFLNSRMLAEAYLAVHKYREAWPYCLEALDCQKKGAGAGVAVLLLQAGTIALNLGELPKAAGYASDSLREAEKTREAGIRASAWHLLGEVNIKTKRLAEALDDFRRAREAALQENEKVQACLALNETGRVQALLGNSRQAFAARQMALSEARREQNPEAIATILYDLGSAYLEMGRPQDALPLLQEAMGLSRRVDRAQEIAASVNRLALAVLARKEYRPALRILMDYLPLAEKADLQDAVLATYLQLSEIYLRLGGPEMAASYLHQAYDLRNKMFEEEKARLVREVEARYESEKKQKEYNLLRHEIRIKALDLNQKSLQISFLLALSALTLIIALILYNRYRFRFKAHQELEQAHRQIQEKQVQLTEANRRLDEMTREDPLTGLANRRELLSRFEQEKVRFLRSGRPFSLIMADLDDFKSFNDTYGHSCGDDILKTLASLLRSMIRGQDIVGRWGGDEFLMLLPETGLAGGEAVARKVKAKVQRTTFPWKDKDLKVRLSQGVSTYRRGMEFDDCLKAADQAMFRRKRRGKSGQRAA